ncbi:hypothetical protein HJG60_011988 [Phyllostomus discolor]|uniref:Uncharacterized protein n=1 Tax=Phyllostomus discolor TaxID=89673 RepID=A0A833ZP66_9CHIR|nr:hypothetical protein HJG60_011988 [Phyllostomus discolor]
MVMVGQAIPGQLQAGNQFGVALSWGCLSASLLCRATQACPQLWMCVDTHGKIQSRLALAPPFIPAPDPILSCLVHLCPASCSSGHHPLVPMSGGGGCCVPEKKPKKNVAGGRYAASSNPSLGEADCFVKGTSRSQGWVYSGAFSFFILGATQFAGGIM